MSASTSLYPTRKPLPAPTGLTEFEILKASHKFLREQEEAEGQGWDDRLAAKYYSSLYREFAVCDLKHYKSGEFALRWRTEEEVLSGAGETTCGNTRCKDHELSTSSRNFDRDEKQSKALTTLELPFAYVEHGENKSALVKVVLCDKCLKKLMWKRRKAKEQETKTEKEIEEPVTSKVCLDGTEATGQEGTRPRKDRYRRDLDRERKHRDRSRSFSPHRSSHSQSSRRREAERPSCA
ncbi:hypothetical protein E1B28_012411 [Marasmius oreades]|uniref:Protein FRA10AC1 n=1 Tax=Marasmius oreades TaxID=181124 RepID=A0A9P7UQR9_9AGAR|nr:uncharacterized protein E1B28_012411 [Marasmius oreades]KAG7088414.1 hypothetical protein E1B28_012411 [Marasmius oreades]